MRSADYVIKRVLFAIVTVFIAITLNFFLFRAVPGDAVDALRCRQCSARVQGASPPGARPGQIDVDAVPALRHRPPPRRPRHVPAHAEGGPGRARGADQEHAADDRARHALRNRLRDDHGGDLRLATGHGGRQGRVVDVARLLLDADPVARPADGPVRRRGARAADLGDRGPDAGHPRRRLDLGRRRRPAAAHVPAGADARARAVRRLRADHAFGDARDARRGLRAHGAGQGALELGDRPQARPPQRAAADHDADRPVARLHHRRARSRSSTSSPTRASGWRPSRRSTSATGPCCRRSSSC